MGRLVLLLAALVLTCPSGAVWADDLTATEREIERLQKVRELEVQIEELRKARDELDERAGVLLDQVEAKEAEILRLQREIKYLRSPKELIFGEPIIGGPLASGVTFRTGDYWDTVLAAQGKLEQCFIRERTWGRFVVQIHVDADGHVRNATKEAGTVVSSATEICIRGHFMEMRFPAHDENSTASQLIEYPE